MDEITTTLPILWKWVLRWAAWREEIQARVGILITERGEYIPQPIESELAVNEALTILHSEESE